MNQIFSKIIFYFCSAVALAGLLLIIAPIYFFLQKPMNKSRLEISLRLKVQSFFFQSRTVDNVHWTWWREITTERRSNTGVFFPSRQVLVSFCLWRLSSKLILFRLKIKTFNFQTSRWRTVTDTPVSWSPATKATSKLPSKIFEEIRKEQQKLCFLTTLLLRQVPDWHWSWREPQVCEGEHGAPRLRRVRQLRDHEASYWVGSKVRSSI